MDERVHYALHFVYSARQLHLLAQRDAALLSTGITGTEHVRQKRARNRSQVTSATTNFHHPKPKQCRLLQTQAAQITAPRDTSYSRHLKNDYQPRIEMSSTTATFHRQSTKKRHPPYTQVAPLTQLYPTSPEDDATRYQLSLPLERGAEIQSQERHRQVNCQAQRRELHRRGYQPRQGHTSGRFTRSPRSSVACKWLRVVLEHCEA